MISYKPGLVVLAVSIAAACPTADVREASDLACLGRERRIDTEDLAIGGGKGFPTGDDAREHYVADLAERTGLPPDRIETLLPRYGTRAADVAAFCAADGDTPLENHPTCTAREIEFIIRNERVVHLDDLLLRRTALALLGELTSPLLDELLAITARVLNWPPQQLDAERTRTVDTLLDRHGVTLD